MIEREKDQGMPTGQPNGSRRDPVRNLVKLSPDEKLARTSPKAEDLPQTELKMPDISEILANPDNPEK